MAVSSVVVQNGMSLFHSPKPSNAKLELPHGDKPLVESMTASHVGGVVDKKA